MCMKKLSHFLGNKEVLFNCSVYLNKSDPKQPDHYTFCYQIQLFKICLSGKLIKIYYQQKEQKLLFWFYFFFLFIFQLRVNEKIHRYIYSNLHTFQASKQSPITMFKQFTYSYSLNKTFLNEIEFTKINYRSPSWSEYLKTLSTPLL